MPDLETPEEDAVEQLQTVTDPEHVVPQDEGEVPLEVDEADHVESTLEVPLDEDDWR